MRLILNIIYPALFGRFMLSIIIYYHYYAKCLFSSGDVKRLLLEEMIVLYNTSRTVHIEHILYLYIVDM